MSDEDAYRKYQEFCQRIGCDPAIFEKWLQVTKSLASTENKEVLDRHLGVRD